MMFHREMLLKLKEYKMPYGKYKGFFLIDLPEYYLSWWHTKGYPAGELGTMLASVYEIKLNGLEYLIRNI